MLCSYAYRGRENSAPLVLTRQYAATRCGQYEEALRELAKVEEGEGPGESKARPAVHLRACYALPGTGIVYADRCLRTCYALPRSFIAHAAMCPRACYAIPGTSISHAAMRRRHSSAMSGADISLRGWRQWMWSQTSVAVPWKFVDALDWAMSDPDVAAVAARNGCAKPAVAPARIPPALHRHGQDGTDVSLPVCPRNDCAPISGTNVRKL